MISGFSLYLASIDCRQPNLASQLFAYEDPVHWCGYSDWSTRSGWIFFSGSMFNRGLTVMMPTGIL